MSVPVTAGLVLAILFFAVAFTLAADRYAKKHKRG